MTRTEPPGDLLIRARRAHDDVAADPDRFRSTAERLVAEARRARQPEALALALRAMAWADRARLDDHSAIRLLDEACRIARRHHLDETLAELLMSHAAVSQELGRMTVAQRDRFLGELDERMREAARKFEFEKAAQIRDKIKALRARSVEGIGVTAS